MSKPNLPSRSNRSNPKVSVRQSNAGVAGAHAYKLALERFGRAMRFYAGAVLAVAGSLLLLSKWNTSTTRVMAAAGFAAAAWMVLSGRSHMLSARKAAVGAKSERRVRSVLRRAGVGWVGESVLLGAGGDADFVVVGPMLAAVEVKTGRGRVSYQHGKMKVGARVVPGDPVSQVTRQAVALKNKTKIWSDAVVCVPDMTGDPFRVGGQVWVCSLRDLPLVLSRLPARVEPRDLKWVVSHITRP